MKLDERRFTYEALKPGGEAVSATVAAADAHEALRRLSRDKLVVTRLDEADASNKGLRRRGISATNRILVLKQLAFMVRAGVDLLEAIHTIAAALASSAIAQGLYETAAGLRRGDSVAKAFRAGLPGYPPHVYALIQVGEATGRLDRVLQDSARQLEFDHRTRRELKNALTYPTFLLAAGGMAVLFLFVFVVPRFAAMIGDAGSELSGLSKAILQIGMALHAHFLWFAIVALVVVFAVGSAASSPAGRERFTAALWRVPGISSLMLARHRATWARIVGLSLGSGVNLLLAAELALAAIPECRFRRELSSASQLLRAGKPVAAAFGGSGALTLIDLSLLKVGQRSGSLPEMFDTIAAGYEDELTDRLKRTTVLVEQAAIAAIALAIGLVVVGLVGALTGIYDTIG